MFKPLDFVRTKNPSTQHMVGLITEVSSFVNGADRTVSTASVTWIGKSGLMVQMNLKNAWWRDDELEVIDNLPRLLAINMCHPFGQGHKHANEIFKREP